MHDEIISIIVPCYNVEKYVSKCIESIINQTYKNLEIILVDDSSTDNTFKILEEYVKKDKRIKLIQNTKNSGLSYSRNRGIEEATGNHIGFIDSDDYISLDFYEKLMLSIKENNSDIALADIKVVNEDTDVVETVRCYSNNEFNLLNVVDNGLAASACNKLFKKEIFSKYLFEVGKLNEDLAVVIPALVNAKKISFTTNTYYYYIQRGGSIQNSKFSDKRFDIFYGVETTLDRIKDCDNYEELKDAIVYNQLITLFLFVIINLKDKKERKLTLKKYNQLISRYSIIDNKHLLLFLEKCGKKHRIYYTSLLKLVLSKHYYLANNLISFYNIICKVMKKSVIEEQIDLEGIIDSAEKQSELEESEIKISVIVPNYNYSRFLYQRIYSILNQNYKIYELIILDDKSSDDSVKVIDEIVDNIKEYINVKTVYNTENSGSAFKQWQKGFEIATGDYIWIAEADDYCKSNMLKKLVKPISNNSNIMISYCDTAFIDTNGYITMKSIKPEIDIQKSNHWNKSYINNGLDEIRDYSFLNNTIANVSSCLIKNGDYSNILNEAGKYKQAGDWLIYVDIMSKGDISYIDKPMNYYRLHGNNVSSTMDYQKHLNELLNLYDYYIARFELDDTKKQKINDRIEYLKKQWNLDVSGGLDEQSKKNDIESNTKLYL